ncbi:MAG TPA: hypothetical protein VFV93_14265 [Thermomicrobiales bacterium]|nr:hypothetical protein [Thermomicrobiales bacterium]
MTEVVARLASFLKETLSVRGVASVLIVAGAIWVASGLRLRGRLLAAWLLVPVLIAVASVCIAGVKRLDPDESLEGPHLIRVAHNDAITLSDLVGVAFAGMACLLAMYLIWRRIQARAG